MAFVGRIVLEDANGTPVAEGTYAIARDLREPGVVWAGTTYYQNQQVDGTWHYRATREPGRPARDTDPALLDVQVIDPPVPPAAVCPTCGREMDA